MFGEWSLVVPVPVVGGLFKLWARFMKPRVEFGSPTQRAKLDEPTKSWWHIPIKIYRRWPGSEEIRDCQIYLEDFGNDKPGHQIKMCWGDYLTQDFVERATLRVGEVNLVPLVVRNEDGNDNNSYITDAEYFENRMNWAIPGDRMKRRFRLFVTVGKFKSVSKNYYLIRTPRDQSNGQFSLEIEYEGRGTRAIPLRHAGHLGE